ncbi:MAG: 50S ribosomal protein L32 [Streptococcus lutetiensis]|nr:50S ribosomal protein L32 [Streptococcus lutetiensis]
MAVPARHTSKAKKNKRRTHYKLTAPSVKFDTLVPYFKKQT